MISWHGSWSGLRLEAAAWASRLRTRNRGWKPHLGKATPRLRGAEGICTRLGCDVEREADV